MALLVSESNHTTEYQPIPAGMYIARCYGLIQIGRYVEFSKFLGKDVVENKIRITWELPTLLKEFKAGEGEKPYSISKEFTLSLNEKGKLRPFLNSWRGKSFSEEELKGFDIEAIVGAPCMLNIIHKQSNSGKAYEEIATITPVVKGMEVPHQINPNKVLTYEKFDFDLFNALPEFIKEKMIKSDEYKKLTQPEQIEALQMSDPSEALPF